MGSRGRRPKPRRTALGTYLESLRQDAGWSLRDLAKKAGVSDRTIFKIEVEERPRLRHATLDKIAGALGTNPNRLFERASLTPRLTVSPTTGPSATQAEPEPRPRTFHVTDEEFSQIDLYLAFLRYAEICQRV